jgi:hypothetical protein
VRASSGSAGPRLPPPAHASAAPRLRPCAPARASRGAPRARLLAVPRSPAPPCPTSPRLPRGPGAPLPAGLRPPRRAAPPRACSLCVRSALLCPCVLSALSLYSALPVRALCSALFSALLSALLSTLLCSLICFALPSQGAAKKKTKKGERSGREQLWSCADGLFYHCLWLCFRAGVAHVVQPPQCNYFLPFWDYCSCFWFTTTASLLGHIIFMVP